MLNFRLDNNNDLNFNLESVEREDFELQKLLFNVIVGAVTSVNGQTGDVTIDIPDKISDLINDSGFITENEVPVKSVNGKTGDVTIDTPTKISQLINDSGYQKATDVDNKISTHNSSSTAHQDIRDDISVTIAEQTFDTNQDFADFLIPAIGDAFSDVHDSIGNIQELIPDQATASNKLADKNFVNSSVQTATANFRGNWDNYAQIPTNVNDYPTDYAGNKTPTVNDYLVVQDASDYTLETLEGTWRFKYTGNWSVDGKAGWHPEYQVNETPMTAEQLAALNSGITAGLVANIPTVPDITITIGANPNTGDMIWSGADSIETVRNSFNNGGSIRVEAPLLTEEVYNVTEIWWKDSNHDMLIVQSVDNDAALIQIGISNDYSVEMDSVNLQEKLQAGANISINGNRISASVPSSTSQLINNGSDGTSTYVEADELGAVATSNSYNDLDDKPTPITVDSALDSSSTNPVESQALYDAIVGKEIIFPVYTSAWSEPYGTNPYVTNTIVTLPAGSFTDNCMIELMIDDKFNDFAKYGFVLYGAEAESQRIWLTAMDKPTSTVYLKVKVYTYDN